MTFRFWHCKRLQLLKQLWNKWIKGSCCKYVLTLMSIQQPYLNFVWKTLVRFRFQVIKFNFINNVLRIVMCPLHCALRLFALKLNSIQFFFSFSRNLFDETNFLLAPEFTSSTDHKKYLELAVQIDSRVKQISIVNLKLKN